MTATPPRPDRRLLAVLLLGHAALVLWAAEAWISGPFLGQGILDGHEVLELARTGRAGAFQTKGPLYPALLAAAFGLVGDSAWTVALLGLALSCSLLVCVHALALELEEPRAAPWAAGFYAISGSGLVFAVQPLPVLAATTLLGWGLVLLLRSTRTSTRLPAAWAGVAFGACIFTRAPLLIAVAATLATVALRGSRRAALSAAGSMVLVTVVCLASFGERAWPTGSMLNLRQGNGGQRSGISDLRPGPGYDNVRLEAAFAPPEERGEAPAFEDHHRRALLSEVEADPLGALSTVLRKAYLFLQRTETVTAADFRHGLRGFPLAPLLLGSFGLLAPLALVGWTRRSSWPLLPAFLGVFLVNVVWLTSARYRFPALPLVCVSAGIFVATRPSPRSWALALVLALPLNLHLTGIDLLVPADGLVQEARLRLASGARDDPDTRALYAAAFAAGSTDPRAHYEYALVHEALAAPADLELARAQYERALELEPGYAEAAENLVALLIKSGQHAAATERARELTRSSPYAGKVWLNLAGLQAASASPEDVRALEAQGFLRLALRALAQNDRVAFERWRSESLARGLDDARLTWP